jgi:hypothetical protein
MKKKRGRRSNYRKQLIEESQLTKEALQNIMNDRQDWRRHINRICS